MKRTLILVCLVGLAFAPEAYAHAKISPERTPADGVARIVLSVAGEEGTTVKVAVQLPPGMTEVSLGITRGWRGMKSGRVITWSGGSFPQGQEGTFSFKAKFPNTAGARLKFPTVQTYADGTVVRWIGAPSSGTPAPTIVLTAARQPPPPAQPPPPPAPPPPPVTTTSSDEDDDSGIVPWLVGTGAILGLGALGFAALRRRRA